MKLEWQEYNALLDRNFTYRNQLSDYAIRLSSSSCIFCTSRKVDSSLSRKSHFLRPCREVSLYFSIEILFYDDGSVVPHESGTSFYAKLARFECSDQELSSKYWASMKLEWQEYNALLDRNFTYRNQLSDYAIRLSSSSCIFCTSRKVDSSLSSKSHFLRPCREVSLYFSIEILFYDDGSLCPMVWHVFLRKASSIWMLRSRVIVKILSIDETWVTRV